MTSSSRQVTPRESSKKLRKTKELFLDSFIASTKRDFSHLYCLASHTTSQTFFPLRALKILMFSQEEGRRGKLQLAREKSANQNVYN